MLNSSRSFAKIRGAAHRILPAACSCLLLLFQAEPTAHAATGWSRQRTSSLAWLHSVFFVDQNRGWAVGSGGTLIATTDGGRSWQTKPPPTEDTIRDVYFADPDSGLLVCERSNDQLKTDDEPRAYLMKTTDRGESWQRVSMRGATADARIMRAVFNRGGRGWAFGEGGVVYLTNDSGATWIRLQAPTRFLLLGGTFTDDNSGWLVGAGSTILQTSDGGETWHHSRLPAATKVRFNATCFVDSRTGWAVGSGGAIFRTANGGRSWQAQVSGVSIDLLDIKFLDGAEGWAVGAGGVLLHTRDGGYRWIAEPSGTSHALERIFFTDRTHGWAVGFGGTIIAYGAGGVENPKFRR